MPTGIYQRTKYYKEIIRQSQKKRAYLMMGDLNIAKRDEIRKKISNVLKGRHLSLRTEFKKGHPSFSNIKKIKRPERINQERIRLKPSSVIASGRR